MKKKSLVVLGLVMSMSLSMSLLSYAGEWKQDNIGKWYLYKLPKEKET